MKKLSVFVMVIILCLSVIGCSSKIGLFNSSPEKTIVGKWVCDDVPDMAMEFNKNGTGIFYLEGRKADINWTFGDERTYKHKDTGEQITLYRYAMLWDDTFSMVAESGGTTLTLEIANETLKFTKE